MEKAIDETTAFYKSWKKNFSKLDRKDRGLLEFVISLIALFLLSLAIFFYSRTLSTVVISLSIMPAFYFYYYIKRSKEKESIYIKNRDINFKSETKIDQVCSLLIGLSLLSIFVSLSFPIILRYDTGNLQVTQNNIPLIVFFFGVSLIFLGIFILYSYLKITGSEKFEKVILNRIVFYGSSFTLFIVGVISIFYSVQNGSLGGYLSSLLILCLLVYYTS